MLLSKGEECLTLRPYYVRRPCVSVTLSHNAICVSVKYTVSIMIVIVIVRVGKIMESLARREQGMNLGELVTCNLIKDL